MASFLSFAHHFFTSKTVVFSKGGKMSKKGSSADDDIGTTPLPRPDGSSKAAKLFKPKGGKAYYTSAKSGKGVDVTEDPASSFDSPTSVSLIICTFFLFCNIVLVCLLFVLWGKCTRRIQLPNQHYNLQRRGLQAVSERVNTWDMHLLMD